MKTGVFVLCLLAAVRSAAASSFDESLERAIALAAEERHAEAREALDPLLDRDSAHPRARWLDGILRAHEGRVSEAIEVLERLRRDHPEMAESWNALSVLHAAEGRFDEARESLLAALERRPSARGRPNLGDLYAKLARRARKLAAAASADARPESSEGPSIPLSRSAGNGSAPRPSDARPANASPSDTRALCLRSGGIEDRRVLAGVEEWLESHGAEVLEVRRERKREVGSHQVYLPPLADRETAAARVREYRARGVRDVEVIESGPLANGISFGPVRGRGQHAAPRRGAPGARLRGPHPGHLEERLSVLRRSKDEDEPGRNPGGVEGAFPRLGVRSRRLRLSAAPCGVGGCVRAGAAVDARAPLIAGSATGTRP